MIKVGKKKIFALVLLALLCFLSFFISSMFGVIILLIALLCLQFIAISLVLNKLVISSNWYKNIFVHTNQFVTNSGYRKDLQRNYEIVNLGSNPALYSFFYEDIKGQNWATGSQGPEMDLEILKYYHSYIKEGGVVLIPIVAFSSCTPLLWHEKNNYLSMPYYSRFAKVLEDRTQAQICIPQLNHVRRWIKYPLFLQPRTIVYLLRDKQPDNTLSISEQPMTLLELNNDADKWLDGWKHEFNIKDLNAPLDEKMEKYHEECADKYAEIISFCKERGLRPVLIFPPISSVLNNHFSDQAKETYVYSFVQRVRKRVSVEFLDYMNDKSFGTPELYFNSFFLNLRGRKMFTRQVLNDLGLL